MRRRNSGLVDETFDLILAVVRRSPVAGGVLTALFGVLGRYLYWVKPDAAYHLGRIVGVFAWGLGALCAVSAVIGWHKRQERQERFDATHTAEDLRQMTWQQVEQGLP